MAYLLVTLLNGLSYGLLLFMLSAGFTLIFSMLGVLNFAHAGFYMLGAYVGYTLAGPLGFWPALVLAPLLVGALGAGFEYAALRRVHRFGHVAELLVTFGLATVILELVQLAWGHSARQFELPDTLHGPAFTLVDQAGQGLTLVWGAAAEPCLAALSCTPFPRTRLFTMVVALLMLAGLWMVLARTRIGLVMRAAVTHPHMVEALGHPLPRIFMGVFGVGTGLAALAGMVAGSTFVTEPSMAAAMGPVIFVVVVLGGMGSLAGAFLAALFVGLLQTCAVAFDHPLAGLLQAMGLPVAGAGTLGRLRVAQLAPLVPYVLLVLALVLRPRGLLGPRDN